MNIINIIFQNLITMNTILHYIYINNVQFRIGISFHINIYIYIFNVTRQNCQDNIF